MKRTRTAETVDHLNLRRMAICQKKLNIFFTAKLKEKFAHTTHNSFLARAGKSRCLKVSVFFSFIFHVSMKQENGYRQQISAAAEQIDRCSCDIEIHSSLFMF